MEPATFIKPTAVLLTAVALLAGFIMLLTAQDRREAADRAVRVRENIERNVQMARCESVLKSPDAEPAMIEACKALIYLDGLTTR